MTEFITVCDVGTNPRLILRQLRHWTQVNFCGDLKDEVQRVDDYQPYHVQMDEIMWLFTKHHPKNYRFVAAPGHLTKYGYEWSPECEAYKAETNRPDGTLAE